ncbi:MAG: SusC/RagA family TonB-linked outer membrane protein [Bacteroidales bacterium]|nr:SusC/RagA family TonB-linked outer membrane protein [Bacteroidales bacterium]
MKKLGILLFFISFLSVSLFAQRTITGKITDENGDELPGAIIRVQNTNVAALSSFDGTYTIVVPAGADSLEFSAIEKQPVVKGVTSDVIDVQLEPTKDIQVTQVVVVGMGIKQDEKKVGYAISTVGGDDLVKSQTSSAMNALQGKIPGVNITTASGASGASTRVIFRGFSTIYGSNQPLYVVDGVPINNAFSGSTSLNGGTDFGNQANDINPDNIESISFLKGSAATAIYGNRAASGVIIITTKSGGNNNNNKTSVSISSSYKFSSPLRLPQLQNIYGQGIYGNWDQRENTSFGPKFDDQLHYWGHVVDGQRLIKPYSALPNNVADFFEIGHFMQNSVSVSGGDNNTSYRLSFSNTNDDGIMPYDKDSYKRNTVSLHGRANLSNKISSEATFTYLNKKNKFVPTGQGGQSVWNNVLQQPRDIPIIDLANYQDQFYDINTYYSPYTTNPYWPLLENGNTYNEDRMYGMAQIGYEITPHFNAMYRIGADISNSQTKEWRAKKINDGDGFNAGVDNEFGSVEDYTVWRNQLNSDFLLTYSNNFGPFSLSVLAGHNINQYSYHSQYQYGSNLDIEGFYHISNTTETPTMSTNNSLSRIVGVYGNVDLSYNGWLNFAVTGRNDWSSTLPQKNNSFFYPGASLGFVFTDAIPAFENIKAVFPYGKIRLSYGKTGKDASAYSIYPYFSQNSRFPLPNQVNGFTVGNSAGSPDLTPEMTSEFEIGTDLRFFNGRYRLDFTYYNRTINRLIFPVELAPSTGYTYVMSNLGSMSNKGIELQLILNVLDKENLFLNFIWNFSINRSEIIQLGDMDVYSYTGLLGGTETWFRFYGRDSLGNPGGPLGEFEVSKPEIWVDGDGVEHFVVNAQGTPKLAEEGYDRAGTSQPDFITGFTTELTLFKIFNVSATLDWHQGGIMYSRTAGMLYFTGITPTTLYNDRQPFIVPNSVVKIGEDGDGNPIYAENTRPVIQDNMGGMPDSYWDRGGTLVGKHELVDKTFIKLRDLVVSVSIPSKYLQKTPFGSASVGFVGNNLLIWTPSSNNIIDPEMTTFGNDLEAEFGEFGATPTIRSLGFNLTLKF